LDNCGIPQIPRLCHIWGIPQMISNLENLRNIQTFGEFHKFLRESEGRVFFPSMEIFSNAKKLRKIPKHQEIRGISKKPKHLSKFL